MKFTQSMEILELVNESNNFVILCHEGPDEDSFISCLSMKKVLEEMGKKVDLFSVDGVGVRYKYLDPDKIIIKTDPNKVNYDKYDIFFALDVNELKRLGINTKINFKGKIINIDHHEDSGFGDVNLIDNMAGATSALLYYLFKDWGVKIDHQLLDFLLIAIVADGGVFQYVMSPNAFRTVADIIDDGGDYQKAIYNINQRYDLMVFKFWSEVINLIEIDKEHRFAYAVVPYEIIKKFEKYGVRSRQVADTYLRSLNDTDFGVVIFEDENGFAKVSIRTRTPEFYVVELLKRLGGGGHLTGGGASAKEETFEKSYEKILSECRKFSKEKQNLRNNV